MKEILTPADKKAFLSDYASKKSSASINVSTEEAQRQVDGSRARRCRGARGSPPGPSSGGRRKRNVPPPPRRALRPLAKADHGRCRDPSEHHDIPSQSEAGEPGDANQDGDQPDREQASFEAISRRIASRTAMGANPEAIDKASKAAWSFFKNTDFDPTIAEDYESTGKLGEHNNFALPEGMLTSNPPIHTRSRPPRARSRRHPTRP